MAKVSVVIVGWNHASHLIKCIKSVYKQSHRDIEIIYVDNASSDNSPEIVQNNFPDVQLHINSRNLGFCKANNQGFKLAKGTFLFQLNPDTVLEPNCITELHNYLTQNQHVGICGPKMLLMNQPSRLNSLGMSIDSNGKKYHIGDHLPDSSTLNPGKVPFISGAAIFYRKSSYIKLGGLDTNLFAFGDDTEISLRFWKNNLECHIVPQACLYHFRNAASRESELHNDKVWFYAIRNRSYPFWVYFPIRKLWDLRRTLIKYRLQYLIKGLRNVITKGKTYPEFQASIASFFLFIKALNKRRKFKLTTDQYNYIFSNTALFNGHLK